MPHTAAQQRVTKFLTFPAQLSTHSGFRFVTAPCRHGWLRSSMGYPCSISSSESGQAPAAAWSPADLRSPLSSSTWAGGDDSSSLPNGSLGVVRSDEGIEVYVPLPLCSIALLFCINSGAQWRIQLDSGPILLPFCLAHFGQCAASQNSIQVIQMIRRGGGHDDR